MRLVIVVVISLVIVACHSPAPPSSIPPPAVGVLSLTCPADVSVNHVHSAQPVAFTAPGTSGGLSPITESCAPASGASFPVGMTDVACTAADAGQPAQHAACQFSVTLVADIPHIALTQFMAFGDSITKG